MSNPIQTPLASGETAAAPSVPRAAADLAADCKNWEGRCNELREELHKTQAERDAYLKAVYRLMRDGYSAPDFTKADVLAHLDDKPGIHDIIAEMEGAEKSA